nr:hypothetical protein [Corynebacterium bovis]
MTISTARSRGGSDASAADSVAATIAERRSSSACRMRAMNMSWCAGKMWRSDPGDIWASSATLRTLAASIPPWTMRRRAAWRASARRSWANFLTMRER